MIFETFPGFKMFMLENPLAACWNWQPRSAIHRSWKKIYWKHLWTALIQNQQRSPTCAWSALVKAGNQPESHIVTLCTSSCINVGSSSHSENYNWPEGRVAKHILSTSSTLLYVPLEILAKILHWYTETGESSDKFRNDLVKTRQNDSASSSKRKVLKMFGLLCASSAGNSGATQCQCPSSQSTEKNTIIQANARQVTNHATEP